MRLIATERRRLVVIGALLFCQANQAKVGSISHHARLREETSLGEFIARRRIVKVCFLSLQAKFVASANKVSTA